MDRGLLELTRERGRIGAAEFEWTEAGREADAQLSRWMELASEHLAQWVRSDPARAAAFTKEAGSAVLLMKDQFPELDELSRREGMASGDGGGGEGFPAGHPTHAHQAGLVAGGETLDLGGLDFGGFDFGGLGDLGGGLGDFGGGGGDGGGGGGNGGG